VGIVNCAVFASGTSALSAGWDGTVRLWNLETAKEIARLADHRQQAKFVALAPDDRTAVSAGFDKTLRLLDLQTKTEIARFSTKPAQPSVALFHPLGFVTVEDRFLRVRAPTGEELYRSEELPSLAHCITMFSTDGHESALV